MVDSLFFRGPHLDLSSADRLPGHHGTQYNDDQYNHSDLRLAAHCEMKQPPEEFLLR